MLAVAHRRSGHHVEFGSGFWRKRYDIKPTDRLYQYENESADFIEKEMLLVLLISMKIPRSFSFLMPSINRRSGLATSYHVINPGFIRTNQLPRIVIPQLIGIKISITSITFQHLASQDHRPLSSLLLPPITPSGLSAGSKTMSSALITGQRLYRATATASQRSSVATVLTPASRVVAALQQSRGYATPKGPPPANFRTSRKVEWHWDKETTLDRLGKYFLMTEMARGMYVLLEQFFRPPYVASPWPIFFALANLLVLNRGCSASAQSADM